jgi:hypothetical protein
MNVQTITAALIAHHSVNAAGVSKNLKYTFISTVTRFQRFCFVKIQPTAVILALVTQTERKTNE